MQHTLIIPAVMLALIPAIAPAGVSDPSEIFVRPDNQFEVLTQKSPSPSDYWCAAGTYAVRQLSKPVTQSIYVWRGRSDSQAQPGKTAVLFAFTPPPGGAASSYSNSVDIVGNSLSVAQAQQYCSDRLTND